MESHKPPVFAARRIAGVVILHPDPVLKHRHRRRQVLRPPFVTRLAAALAPGTPLFVQTDVPELGSRLQRAMEADSARHWFEPSSRMTVAWAAGDPGEHGASARSEHRQEGGSHASKLRESPLGVPSARERSVRESARDVSLLGGERCTVAEQVLRGDEQQSSSRGRAVLRPMLLRGLWRRSMVGASQGLDPCCKETPGGHGGSHDPALGLGAGDTETSPGLGTAGCDCDAARHLLHDMLAQCTRHTIQGDDSPPGEGVSLEGMGVDDLLQGQPVEATHVWRTAAAARSAL